MRGSTRRPIHEKYPAHEHQAEKCRDRRAAAELVRAAHVNERRKQQKQRYGPEQRLAPEVDADDSQVNTDFEYKEEDENRNAHLGQRPECTQP